MLTVLTYVYTDRCGAEGPVFSPHLDTGGAELPADGKAFMAKSLLSIQFYLHAVKHTDEDIIIVIIKIIMSVFLERFSM